MCRVRNAVDALRLLAMADHTDIIHRIHREWEEDAYVLTLTARDFGVLLGGRTGDGLRAFSFSLTEEQITKMMTNRSTVPEQSGSCRLGRRIDCSGSVHIPAKWYHVTQAELPAAVEAVEAIMSLMRCCEVVFDLNGPISTPENACNVTKLGLVRMQKMHVYRVRAAFLVVV